MLYVTPSVACTNKSSFCRLFFHHDFIFCKTSTVDATERNSSQPKLRRCSFLKACEGREGRGGLWTFMSGTSRPLQRTAYPVKSVYASSVRKPFFNMTAEPNVVWFDEFVCQRSTVQHTKGSEKADFAHFGFYLACLKQRWQRAPTRLYAPNAWSAYTPESGSGST